jgi:Family of unknown function (DUF6600)/FecR protein
MSVRKLWCLAAGALFVMASMTAHATSHVRIVRLSYVDGNVQMDRASGQGMERAILNAPIIEGARILTGANGLAEVEFEDNSTVRLGEATEVRFSQLLINDEGDKVNEVDLVRGTMYFDARGDKHGIDRVTAAGHTFIVRRNSQLRFMMLGDQAQVSVLGGEAQFESNGQIAKIKKNDTVTVDSTNPAGMVLAKGVDSIPLDRWNSERAAYQAAYSYDSYGYGSRGMSGFGYADLAYYGGFTFLPGYGTVWQPYGASSWNGWNPYMAGGWMYTSGLGYTWASAYPWGWMPSHYGSWIYVPTGGWFWSPGKSFKNGGVVNNWQPTAPVVQGPPGYAAPAPPQPAPVNGARPSVLVGRIGTAPAYLPGGPVPPNFRSVINERDRVTGMNPLTAGGRNGGGSATANHGSRAVGTARAGAAQNGHVFAPPASPSPMSSTPMTASPMAPGYGGGGGSIGPAHGSGAPMSGTPGGGHATAGAGTRGGARPSPK